nr:MAG TPA: hypothetical protein [Caudoviricetes sp.]
MAEPLSKLAEKCKSCPKSEKCEHKRMELCALADLPPQNLTSATQGILIDAARDISTTIASQKALQILIK